MSLTNDQYKLLDNLYKIGPRRTNILAKSLGWDNQHTPHIGLQLREQQLVSSTNDGCEYNKWDITATGRAKYLEETAARKPKKVAKEAPVTVPVQPVEWIVLPANKNFTALRFPNEEEAVNKAKYLASTNGYDYVVLRAYVADQIKYIPAVSAKIEVIKS